jgi:hypothetical protein
VVPQSRYAALLVSLHGTALYERRDLTRLSRFDGDRVRAYLAGQRDLQLALRASLHAGEAEVRRNQRLLWTWDSLSLGLLLGWAPYELKGVPTAAGETDVALRETTLHPWPFAAERVELRCEGRRLSGPYPDEAAMRAALAIAPWETIAIELERL